MQPALAPPPVLGPSRQKPDESLHIEAVWESAYDQIVRPEKAIVLNAYFIRHLSHLGPELGWMYIAFRQAAYSTGGRIGQRAARFTGKAIAALSGSTERTFWNRAAKAETWQKLAGLVTLLDEKPIWDESSPTPKRLPRKYSVAMTLPLTGPDTGALRRWLLENWETCQGASGVLRAACETPVTELLAQPGETATPSTVHRLVRDLFASELPAKELEAQAERLHQHIQPSTDILVLTLFFVEHILPQLGTGPGWLLAILRDHCWTDPSGRGTRSQVTIPGGYAEMAGWLGLSRAKTIWEWLRTPLLQIYLRHIQSGLPETNQWDAARTFDVLLEEVPVEIVQVCLRHLHEPNGANFSIGVADFSVSNGADFSIGVARFSQPDGAFFSHAMAQISEFSGAICRVFKLLSSIKLLKQIAPPEITPQPEGNLGAGAPVRAIENQPQEPEPSKSASPRIQALPEDVQKAAEAFVTAFNLLPPDAPEPGEKGGDFALWIKGLRKLNSIAVDYGIPVERAIQQAHAYWNQRPFTLTHPLALKSAMQSALSRQKSALAAPVPAANPGSAAYDPAQRRKEISTALGFDIDQPLTPEQQSALQTYLDSLYAGFPQNPLKS